MTTMVEVREATRIYGKMAHVDVHKGCIMILLYRVYANYIHAAAREG